jgi:tetratricopeptide (TPR) repeat protein
MLINLVYSQVGLGELREAYASLREALQLNIENDSISWVLFSLVGYANILAAEGKRKTALQILGLCMNHPETNSDTHRDIHLVLEDLKKVQTDDIEAELESGKAFDVNKTVLMALGG